MNGEWTPELRDTHHPSLVTRHWVLSVVYEEHGPPAGPAVLLLHGFPYDVRAYDEVTPLLVAKGCGVIDPGRTTATL